MESLDMQHQMMGYDRSATMFSPDGHILQVEYAEKTVRLGTSSIGIVCSDGVLIISDKRIIDKLIVHGSLNKIQEIDDHIIASAAGILSDARILTERAQLVAQQHKLTYDTPVDVLSIIKDIANIKQQYTQHPGVRPFGVAFMVAGVDDGIGLFVSDITGNYAEYHAVAIGENDDKIKDELRKRYRRDMGIEEALKLGLEIFKEVQAKDFNVDKFDAAYVNKKDKKIVRLNGEQLKKFVK